MSTGTNGADAAEKAYVAAQAQLQSHEPNAILVFASSVFDQQQVVSTIKKLSPESAVLAGASTAGEISQTGPSMTSSVVVMLFASDTVRFFTAAVENASGIEEAAGTQLAQKIKAQTTEKIRLVSIFCDGLTINPSAILRGMNTEMPQTPIAGGSGGDDGAYKKTFQYCNDTVFSSSVTALAFTGNLDISIGVRHGWSPISGFRTVTKAEGTVVHEIDDKPAIALYEEFLGVEEAAKLKEVTLAELALSYPLGITDQKTKELYLRAPFYVNAEGSITCGGEVPEGSQVQLMMGSKDLAVAAAKQTAESALAGINTTPAAAIIYSCHVRDSLFESRQESKKEIDAIQQIIGDSVPLAGFYTYAEQAPVNTTNVDIQTCNSSNHNETIVAILLAESHD